MRRLTDGLPTARIITKGMTVMKRKQKKIIENCRDKAYEILELYLDLLSDREKAEAAPINQLASVVGVMFDRFDLKITNRDDGKLPEILSQLRKDCI